MWEITPGTFANEFYGSEAFLATRILFAEDETGRAVGTVAAWYCEDRGRSGSQGVIRWYASLPGSLQVTLGRAMLVQSLHLLAGHHEWASAGLNTSRVDEIGLFLDAGFEPSILTADDARIWGEVARAVRHPAIGSALTRRGWTVPSGIVDWLRGAAIPLVSCEAGNGFRDLEPLREIIGDARIVSMGEATHGTREFFQLKHRMLEFLVEEMGFTAFGVEGSFAESLLVDRYVATGEGDPVAALNAVYSLPGDNQEVLAMVQWIRRHNVSAARPVHFYGFDTQYPGGSAREVILALRACDPELADRLSSRLMLLTNEFDLDEMRMVYARLPQEQREGVVEALREATERLKAAPFPDERARALAKLHAQVALQGEKAVWECCCDEHRDHSMAQTVLSLLDLEGCDGKLALWAHNGHVGRRTPGQMGYQLDRRLGRSQVIIGFAFGDGRFQATDLSDDSSRAFTAPAPSPGSLDETLLQVGLPVFAVDLRRFAGVPGEVGEWLRATHVTRNTGSHFSDDPAKHGWWAERDKVHEQYDILVFVSHTTPPRPVDAR